MLAGCTAPFDFSVQVKFPPTAHKLNIDAISLNLALPQQSRKTQFFLATAFCAIKCDVLENTSYEHATKVITG